MSRVELLIMTRDELNKKLNRARNRVVRTGGYTDADLLRMGPEDFDAEMKRRRNVQVFYR